MSQCFQATVPLVDYLINGTSGPINYFDNKYLRTFKEFTNKYHSSTGSLDPSSVFSIISSQKYHFGNYSQQDSYDAFLTMLETLIREQKVILKKAEQLDDPLNKILDSKVPIGSIFSFSLISRGIIRKFNYSYLS